MSLLQYHHSILWLQHFGKEEQEYTFNRKNIVNFLNNIQSLIESISSSAFEIDEERSGVSMSPAQSFLRDITEAIADLDLGKTDPALRASADQANKVLAWSERRRRETCCVLLRMHLDEQPDQSIPVASKALAARLKGNWPSSWGPPPSAEYIKNAKRWCRERKQNG